MTYEHYMKLVNEADAEMKRSDGHQFVHMLKTRCDNCGRSPLQKGKCPQWFTTFVNILGGKLTNPDAGLGIEGNGVL